MKEVKLIRQYFKNCTIGKLAIDDFHCCTLELPDKGNKPLISCIPIGDYECEYTFSPSLKKNTYEVKDVINRSGIRIHSGNYTSQIKGCILLGKEHLDINKDGVIDVTESKNTIALFEAYMNKEPFILTII